MLNFVERRKMKKLPLRKELFWDVNFQKLDINTHKRLIIERVLSLGNLNEFFFLLSTYDRNTIKQVVKQAGNLDAKTIEFAASYFEINRTDIKCYTKKQSTHIHWD
jgi:hypothetical protein